MANNERAKIVLAALLHDIGKFWQRGDDHFKSSHSIKAAFQENNFDSVVPVYNGGHPKYIHALWTYVFFEKFPRHDQLKWETGTINLRNLAAYHHQPSNVLEGFVSLADRWSSGIDRPDEGEEDVSNYQVVKNLWGEDFVRKVPMHSIFDSLRVGQDTKKGVVQNGFDLQALSVLEKNPPIFSNTAILQNKSEDKKEKYAKLWTSFTQKYEQLPVTDFHTFYHSLLNLLKEYTWCIPSATNILPANVSLFEHLKSTAALAICLYDHYLENENNWDKSAYWNPTLTEDIDPILMLCVDLSGIQKFIYDIASSKAAKSLKGRSFYLQLLMQSITNQILFDEDIKLFYSNIIYASGGKSYILLPNTDKVKKALGKIEQRIEKELWDKYKGKIYAAFGTVSFRYKSFKDENTGNWTSILKSNDPAINQKHFELGELWKMASDRANEQKRGKFKTTILNNFDDFFPKNGIDYQDNTDKCAVSGERFLKKDLKNIGDKEDNQETLVSSPVFEQIKIGHQLKDVDSIATFYQPENWIRGINPGQLDTRISLDKVEKLPKLSAINNRFFINHFPTSFDNFPHYAHQTIFYGGNQMPEKDGIAKSFHDLAEFTNSKAEKQNTKLGFLRMDVDGLGQIFISGLETHNKSFAAYATLSMMLDLFFSGYLNQIRNRVLFRDWVQILYAGGDDLFVIGRWDKVIDFAAMVRTEFQRFVGRSDISISGGVAIVGAKYPIIKAAELAADAEKAAKKFNGNKKDAFTFFGQTIGWGKEFNQVKALKNKFLKLDGQYGRSVLQQLQTYYLMKEETEKAVAEEKAKTKDLSFKWHAAYYLSRLIERIHRNDVDAIDFFHNIRLNLLNNSDFGADRYLDLIALAARWAQYLLKMNLKNDEL